MKGLVAAERSLPRAGPWPRTGRSACGAGSRSRERATFLRTDSHWFGRAARRAACFVLLAASAACRTAPQPALPPVYELYRHEPLKTGTATTSVPVVTCDYDALMREEHHIAGERGVSLFVMRVATPLPRRGVVLFTHGAGSPSSALWDLKAEGASFMRNLACHGFDTYAVDVRSFGGSTDAGPAVRAAEVLPDVAAAMAFARARSGVLKVDLFGWSWGAMVAGIYAGDHPEQIRRLILFAPVYDRKWPARHVKEHAWRTETREDYFKWFDPERESREVLEEHVEALFRFAEGDVVRVPSGPYQDLYGEDAPIWDPRRVRAPTLVIRGEEDRASLEPHARALFTHLEGAAWKRYLAIDGAGHFLFRTHGFERLHSAVAEFLLEPEPGAPEAPPSP